MPGLYKALPNRRPETVADKQVTSMLTAGGAPHPLKQIQQGPSFCPSCGKSHRLGTVCSKALAEAVANYLNKGTITIQGQKRGNPYRDDSTGHFAASPQGKAGGGSKGSEEPASRSTITRQKPFTLQGQGAAPAPSVKTPAAGSDISTAHTMEAPAPSVSAPSMPSASAAPGSTSAGKMSAQPKQPVSGGTVAGKMGAQVKPSAPTPPESVPVSAAAEASEGTSGPFSHDPSNMAYHSARQQALGSGKQEHEAHQFGLEAGAREYANSQRKMQGQSPMDTSQWQAAGRMRSAGQVEPGQQTQQTGAPQMAGPSGTQVSGPPQMTGPSGTQVTGAPAGMPGVAPGSAQQGQAPTAPGAQPTAPGPRPGGKTQGGLLGTITKPWQQAAGGIGAGMFTPGGTTTATAGAIGGTAHGLLNYQGQQQQQPAAQQYQQRQQSAQKQSPTMQNADTTYLNRLRGFVNKPTRVGTP